ncbi:hypothetical protein NBO_60g0016 [Nosema bombycis CQ1]|uniref:Uncharacterized protein n=1 Tax=Nosema bombycis (strain CQ1 / CVCC 102059) TaxID=578461 RepID=R0MHY1_NOSB1|nr:hypothetical protein NBO_60g0016 [Nosema bombycis CQ1]|eukprot:EOB13760.1 hypothetical protein NBO_60g0016 [Nosema bombycis CQ1]
MEKIRGFFYTSNDLRDVDVFYTKVALFIFFVKNTRLFSEKETIVLVKTYFYYMFSCNFLIFSASQENFLTNLAIKSSDKFRGWERNLMKRGDLIRFLFYELPKDNSEFYDMFDHSLNLPLDVNEDERLYYYLSNEIIYMHLAFTKEKEIATVPFDIAFHNLPFGLIAPLKMLLMTNKSIITELLLEKYEECFNSTLSVQVVEKMITIFYGDQNERR